MNALSEQILSELRHLLIEMSDGGSVGPSVYDTARALQFHGNLTGRQDAYAWLIAQQQPDGGWGSADFPLFRHAPTWAALLALQRADPLPGAADAVQAAIRFLERQPDPYAHAVPEDAPIGAELILPQLCGEAASLLGGVAFPATRRCCHCGKRACSSWVRWRRCRAAIRCCTPGKPGARRRPPYARMPTAASASVRRPTAAWRAHAMKQGSTPQVGRADAYLQAASRATRSGIKGVVPSVWPINVFEPCWALYTLHLVGLFAHPALADAVRVIVAQLDARLGVRGLGPALHFAADADDTAVALCVLRLAGRAPAVNALRHFEIGELFVTFPGERNASVSTNIHALQALRLLGKPAAGTSTYIEANRNPHGLWDNEKWHVSWLYPTAHAVAALAQGKPQWRDERALAALLQAQRDDGGWGAGRASTFEETAYALFTLHVMNGSEEPTGRRRIAQAVARALEWMLARHAAHKMPQAPLWIGKELYCPTRVVRVAELAGLWLALRWGRRVVAEGAGAAP